MPFKSESQRRKFAEMLAQGKISKKTFDEWNAATDKVKLPNKVQKGPAKPKSLLKRRHSPV